MQHCNSQIVDSDKRIILKREIVGSWYCSKKLLASDW